MKSGLPGLLTGLHKPELNVTGIHNTDEVSELGPSHSFLRRAAAAEGSASDRGGWVIYLSEPSLSTGMCEMPRLLEKSDLFEEILVKPFPPATRILSQCEAKVGKAHVSRPLSRCGSRSLTWALVIACSDCSKSGVAVPARERGRLCQPAPASTWLLCFCVT